MYRGTGLHLTAAWLVLMLAAPVHAVDGGAVAASLQAPAAELRDRLDAVGDAQDLAAARTYGDEAFALADRWLPMLADLDPAAGAVVQALLDSLGPALDDGDLTDVRSLARAAAQRIGSDLAPLAAEWDSQRTAVATGIPERVGTDRVRVPIVVHHLPPGGLGAFDVGVRIVGATPVQASVGAGTGEAVADGANGTARIASFDAKAFGGFGSGSGFIGLGAVTVEVDNATFHVALDPQEVVDAHGEPVLAVGVDGTVDAASAEQRSGGLPSGARWGLLGAGAAGMWLVARRLRV